MRLLIRIYFRGCRRIWQARGKRGAFNINPGHALCDYTNNWAGIRLQNVLTRGFGPGSIIGKQVEYML